MTGMTVLFHSEAGRLQLVYISSSWESNREDRKNFSLSSLELNDAIGGHWTLLGMSLSNGHWFTKKTCEFTQICGFNERNPTPAPIQKKSASCGFHFANYKGF